MGRWLQVVFAALITGYQRSISPLLGDCCRFEPSCSRYCALCLEHHGVLRGSWLGLLRLLRCNPLFSGGVDPPPLPPHVDPQSWEPNWQRVSAWIDQRVRAEDGRGRTHHQR
ncbi:MAG TPA: membrane protein insertion efficiency factor YidD [Polyangiaceae bacterium]|jgi:hypothetical protein|nr:membrane protein insertion efficiency factor YidD [Polyangiaceae bacterium]